MMMSSNTCISVEDVSKKFSRSLKRSFVYGAKELIGGVFGVKPSTKLRASEFWALRDVSFKLERGESMGIVGLNGSGKTTLLRTVCGILRPTMGAIHVNGRVAPLLALGAGFKPVLSGRENIFLNMSLLGVPYDEITARFKEVVDFAELWEAIDAPIGTYSSGMLARLGFSCAVHTNPSILIVDEVLSVGDAKFRAKCRNKINELRRAGTSMLLVSHSAISVETLCDQCIYLVKGKMLAQGSPPEVIKQYEHDSARDAQKKNANRLLSAQSNALPKTIDETEARITISKLEIEKNAGDAQGYWISGSRGVIRLNLVVNRCPVDQVSINVMVVDTGSESGQTQQLIMSVKDVGWIRLDNKRASACLVLEPVGLRPSIYRLKLSITTGEMHDIEAVIDNVKLVVMDPGNMSNCAYHQPRTWDVSGGGAAGVVIDRTSTDVEAIEDF
jgi:lipopolysaccharide transport system ATP-binding protein